MPSISTLSASTGNTKLFTTNPTSTGQIQIVQNVSNIQQAVPILNHQSANVPFAQVLKQFSAVTSSASPSASPASNASDSSSNNQQTTTNIQIVSLPSTTTIPVAKLNTPSQVAITLQPATTASIPHNQIAQQQDLNSVQQQTNNEQKSSISDSTQIGDSIQNASNNNSATSQENDSNK